MSSTTGTLRLAALMVLAPALGEAVAPAIGLPGARAEAQVAPTLPSDTLGGRKLPPEANVPRAIVAPTLPSDTLRAGACLRHDSIATVAAATTPRKSGAADTSASASGACADGTYSKSNRKAPPDEAR